MAKTKIGKKILEISEGILSSLTDFILAILTFTSETFDPKVAHSLPYALAKVDQRMQKLNYQSIKRAIIYAQKKGWIKENLEVTEEGQKRLKNIFPQYLSPPKWDGNWYLVNFDIPEKIRWKRDVLRGKLEILGFGKLQNSIWISPYNFLGDMEKIVKELNLIPYVILSISDKVGQVTSKTLAEKIWKISKIQKEYQNFISEFEKKENCSSVEMFFRYQSILRKDPKLPGELLPKDWAGEEVRRLYSKLFKEFQK